MKEAFETFSMYGFTIDYPEGSRVEFNSKNRREAGDVVFRLPEDIRIFLSWGELEKVSKRFGSPEEHANYSLNVIERGKKVQNFERVSRDTLPLHNHQSLVNKVRFNEKTLNLFTRGKSIPREAYSLHVHCDKSKRYFVLYAMIPADKIEFNKIMKSMSESFKCH